MKILWNSSRRAKFIKNSRKMLWIQRFFEKTSREKSACKTRKKSL